MMRGTDVASGSLSSYLDLEAQIPAWHPLRKIWQVVNEARTSLDAEFEAFYTDLGRPSVAPELLIRVSHIHILLSVNGTRATARASVESFLPKADDTPPDNDLSSPPGPDIPAEDYSEPTETKTEPMPRPSRPCRTAEVDFWGEKRSNATYAPTTDSDAWLYNWSRGTGAMGSRPPLPTSQKPVKKHGIIKPWNETSSLLR